MGSFIWENLKAPLQMPLLVLLLLLLLMFSHNILSHLQSTSVSVISFQVLTQNRYKLTKRYRKLHEEASSSQSLVSDSVLENAKVCEYQ